jgi:translation initiation factor 3 subunit A
MTLKFVEGSEDMSQLQQYLPALREITLVRLLKQVAQVYQSICFERLLQLAPFTDSFTLERVIVDCVRHNDMQVKIQFFLLISQFISSSTI